MTGENSKSYELWRHGIIEALAKVEAYIDFPDEDLPASLSEEIAKRVIELEENIAHYLNDDHRGEKIREGIYIAIIGAPNVGKSSILNYLAGRDAAIVSETAGTTRDVIEVVMDIAGYKVIIADTAGIRESFDQIENEGIKRALKRAEEADIKLIVFEIGKIDETISALIDNNSIVVINKVDKQASQEFIPISAKTGDGMERLLIELTKKLEEKFSQSEAPLITQARHREALMTALRSLRSFSSRKAD